MNRRLKTLTLLTTILAGSSAFAEVTLYGRVAVGLENDDFQNTTVVGGASIQDFGSYFGLRGIDPVYGETAAIWQIEQFLDITSGQIFNSTTGTGLIVPRNSANPLGFVRSEVNTLASGESYLGIQGGWGRVRVGNLSNYFRSDMGAVDTFNYNNGVDGLAFYSRTPRLISTSFRYDSPSWGGLQFTAMYSTQSNGGNLGNLNSGNTFGAGVNGLYSSPVIVGGIGWTGAGFSAKLGTQINPAVGVYLNNVSGGTYAPAGNQSTYTNAYANRLELGYEDPDGLIIALGLQQTSGWGWQSWPNSGGSFNNYITNPGYNFAGLNSAQYQTQETAFALGWHIGPWTPKLAYVYANNLMFGGSVLSVITGSANQIPNSGYQQGVAELDWNITPKTVVFINYGQITWGSTLQNVAYVGQNGATPGAQVNGGNQSVVNQSSTAIGLTHTF